MSNKDLQRVTECVSYIGQPAKTKEIFIRQNFGPLIKSPAETLPQDTQEEQSPAKKDDL